MMNDAATAMATNVLPIPTIRQNHPAAVESPQDFHGGASLPLTVISGTDR